MKHSKLLILILIFCLLHCSCVFAQNNYSSAAINIFNSGVALHNQGKYELAEQKYIETLKIQPNFTEAKKNLALVYQNLACKYYSAAEYEKAIYYAKKTLALKPNNIYVYEVMARCYETTNDFGNAAITYKKIIALDPKDDSAMHSLAQVYIKSNQFDKSSDLYKQILLINPSDKIAQNNLKYSSYQHSEKILNESINSLTTQHTAPKALYRLIKPSAGITPNTIERMKNILDLVWSEPNGQIMLQTLIQKKIPINITQGAVNANTAKIKKTHTFYLYGIIPIASFDTSSIAVNIPFNYIANFYDTNLSSHDRIYSLQVFMHEFGHAFMNARIPGNFDSMEEELGVSMLGYNISYKIITGRYLDRIQTESYSKGCLESLLKDEHRNLPIFSGFNKTIQAYGIVLPYPEIYSNLPKMYKELLLEKKTTPVPNFYVYMR